MSSAARVQTPLGSSRGFAVLLVGLALAVATVPWMIGMSPALAVAASAVLGSWGARLVWAEALRRGKHAWIGLDLSAAGPGELLRRDGVRMPVSLKGAPWSSAWGLVLDLEAIPHGRHPLAIWRDSVAPDDFRRLRVLARWARPLDGEEPAG